MADRQGREVADGDLQVVLSESEIRENFSLNHLWVVAKLEISALIREALGEPVLQ